MRAVLAALCLILAGCQASKPVSEMSYSEVKQLAAELERRCAAQGYGRGHPEFTACARQEFDREYATRAEANARRRTIANSVYCQNFSGSIVCF